jgi:hypothetical protein
MQDDKLNPGRLILAEAVKELHKQVTILTDQKIQAAIAPLLERIAALEEEVRALKGNQEHDPTAED